jgi:hypothetical protein
VATYVSGSGTSTLTFRYVVSAGQNANPLDYTSSGALTLNGGTIVDAAGNAAKLTLPVPGAAGSLSANKTIVIDTTAPRITITSPTSGSTYLEGQVVTANYGCTDLGGSGVATCVGTVATLSAINTSAVGSHSFSVSASDKAGNVSSTTVHYTVVFGFGGFLSPLPKQVNAGSTIPVKFTLTNALGQAIPSATAAQLASNKDVEVVLTGPYSTTADVESPVLCAWSSSSAVFQCNLKTPSKVREGATYYITVLENVSGTFQAAPPYSSKPSDMNPEPVTFK